MMLRVPRSRPKSEHSTRSVSSSSAPSQRHSARSLIADQEPIWLRGTAPGDTQVDYASGVHRREGSDLGGCPLRSGFFSSFLRTVPLICCRIFRGQFSSPLCSLCPLGGPCVRFPHARGVKRVLPRGITKGDLRNEKQAKAASSRRTPQADAWLGTPRSSCQLSARSLPH